MKSLRNVLLFVIGLLFSVNGIAQETYNLTGKFKTKARISGVKYEAGQKIQILHPLQVGTELFYLSSSGAKKFNFPAKDIENIEFDPASSIKELWDQQKAKSVSYREFLSRSKQYDLRYELEEEALQFLQNMGMYYGYFEDDYLEDYVQSLLYKIHPITLSDKRPGNLFVKIINLPEPNAYTLPNGCIVITTGLLSQTANEDELLGVLAHEVAHFVLDHQVSNINAEINRQKKAEFWAGLAILAAAATEVYVGAKYDIYTGGALTMGTAVVSSAVVQAAAQRIGAKYSHAQEFEADSVAQAILNHQGRNVHALPSVLAKLRDYCYSVGNYHALTGSGSHPSLLSRINSLGKIGPEQPFDIDFQRKISLVTTFNAYQELSAQHLLMAEELVDRNILAGCPTEDDYLLKAIVLRKLYDSPEKNNEALNYVIAAKTLHVTPKLETFKQAGLTLMRIEKMDDAQEAFDLYLEELILYVPTENEKDYISKEIDWTRKMIYKASLK